MNTVPTPKPQPRDIGLYVPLEISAPRHPKIRKLARRLSIPRVTALGHMCTLWAELMSQSPDGYIDDAESVELLAEWEGEEGTFVREALAVGLLDSDGNGYRVHEYYDRLSHLRQVRARKLTRDRVRAHRERKAKANENNDVTTCNAKSVTTALHSVTGVTIAPEQEQEQEHKQSIYPSPEIGPTPETQPTESHDDDSLIKNSENTKETSEATADERTAPDPTEPQDQDPKQRHSAPQAVSATWSRGIVEELNSRDSMQPTTSAEIQAAMVATGRMGVVAAHVAQSGLIRLIRLRPLAWELLEAMGRKQDAGPPYLAATIENMRREGRQPPPPPVKPSPGRPRVYSEQDEVNRRTQLWLNLQRECGYTPDQGHARRMAKSGEPTAEDKELLLRHQGRWQDYHAEAAENRGAFFRLMTKTVEACTMPEQSTPSTAQH